MYCQVVLGRTSPGFAQRKEGNRKQSNRRTQRSQRRNRGGSADVVEQDTPEKVVVSHMQEVGHWKVSSALHVVEIQSFAPILDVTDVPFASMSGGDDLPARVTVSGHPGSGTSTLVAGLCHQLNWEMLNGGQVFRNTAAEKGMTLEAFGQYCIDDDSVDKELDQMLTDAMLSENSPQIVESRLAGWWAFKHQLNCPRIWIEGQRRSPSESSCQSRRWQ